MNYARSMMLRLKNDMFITHPITFLSQWGSDALPSPLLDPLEGPSMLNCGKLGLEGHSRLPTLKGGRGAC